jgi:hypothetical protein
MQTSKFAKKTRCYDFYLESSLCDFFVIHRWIKTDNKFVAEIAKFTHFKLCIYICFDNMLFMIYI